MDGRNALASALLRNRDRHGPPGRLVRESWVGGGEVESTLDSDAGSEDGRDCLAEEQRRMRRETGWNLMGEPTW